MTINKLLILISALLIFAPASLLAGGADHGEHHEEVEAEGPHGGKLLHHDNFELEITVFEQGVPPEMRVYAYLNGKAIDPRKLDLAVHLGRLGGREDGLTFSVENNYLVSQQTVVEPHSYTVNARVNYAGKEYQWSYENFEGRAVISDRLIKLSNIKTQFAGEQTLTFTDTLFGIISPIEQNLFSVNAPYVGIIEKLHVVTGQWVKRGQVIATVQNSTTLQSYQVFSPAAGQVTALLLNRGQSTEGKSLLSMADLSSVWVDLSAFPKNIDKLAIGLPVSIGDNHGGEHAQSTISYIAPLMTGGHIARARAVLDNHEGHWRPGMHVKAKITTRTKDVPLAVSVHALQTFRDMPVVFVQHGNTFEVRMVELGERDGEYVEVLGGLEPGAKYVVENSYLLKADVLKDGAKHAH